MAETAHRKGNECLQVDARVIANACLECSRRYGLAIKTKLYYRCSVRNFDC